MDDFPAGPACPGPRRPSLSVVVPVRNGGRDFERCLRGLRNSTWTDFELIVVDDGSTDDSASQAESAGAIVIRQPIALGPAAARNAGARLATAPIIVFLDADVVAQPATLERIHAHFARDPDLAALFGSYDDEPAVPSLPSRYRNLLHHYVHQQGTFEGDVRPVHSFWTGCGAIRREIFLERGGFDPSLYRRPAIEDIEFGYRLTRAGHRCVIARDVQATHLKRWTVRSIIRTDVFQRGVPWMMLMLRTQARESDLNVSAGQRISVAATGLGLAGLFLTPFIPPLAILFALNVVVLLVANRSFYGFLARKRGWPFAIGAMPLHYLYYVCCGTSVAIALSLWHLRRLRRPTLAPATTTGRIHAGETTQPTPHAETERRVPTTRNR